MLSCLIVDDEQSAIDLLKIYIEKTPFLKLVASTTDPREVLGLLQQHKIDLIFLDIHLPHISGLDLIKVISANTKVIITSAYSEFAVEGFENEALDYLLKPIPFGRFLKAAQKALNASSRAQIILPPVEKEDDYFFLKTDTKGKIVKINFHEIYYVEGMKNYLSVYTKEDRVITLLSMKEIEERLPRQLFMRVHKSYIIALDKIKAVDGNHILLKDVQPSIPLGETYRFAFFQALQEKIVGGRK